MNKITGDLIRELVESRAINAALVAYPDGTYEVRSTVPSDGEDDDYTIVISQADLSLIDHTGSIDFNDLSDEEAALIAESLTVPERD